MKFWRFFLMVCVLCGVAIVATPHAAAQDANDRTRVPLQEALAGHWYTSAWDKHDYISVISLAVKPNTKKKRYFGVQVTWHTKRGQETSDGAIQMSFHKVDRANNFVILTYRAGKFTYFIKYTLSKDRTRMTKQGLDKNLRPLYYAKEEKAVFVDAKTRSPHVPKSLFE